MQNVRRAMIALVMAASGAAMAGGGESGGLPGNGDSSEPPLRAPQLICGETSGPYNGLENNGRFDGFAIALERSGPVFLGWKDLINANSASSWDINDRRALTLSFTDDGEVMRGQFRALPADDPAAHVSAKRIDLIGVRFQRSTGVANIRIETKKLVTHETTSVDQTLNCRMSR